MVSHADLLTIRSIVADTYPKMMNMRLFFSRYNSLLFPVSEETLPTDFPRILSVTHLISSQSHNLGGRPGTTDDVATIPFHHFLSSAALRESPNPIPIHSLMLSSQIFFCLPLRSFHCPLQNLLRHARGS